MWEQVKMPNRHFLRSDIFTVAMVYSFYFRLFSLMNQIVIHPSIYRFPPQCSLRQIVFHRYLHNPSMPGKHIFHHTK